MVTADLLTIAGAAIVVSILVEVIKRLFTLDDAAITRFGPALAVVIGLVIGGGASLYQSADLVQGLLTGLLAGASSMGLYNGVQTARGVPMNYVPPTGLGTPHG